MANVAGRVVQILGGVVDVEFSEGKEFRLSDGFNKYYDCARV